MSESTPLEAPKTLTPAQKKAAADKDRRSREAAKEAKARETAAENESLKKEIAALQEAQLTATAVLGAEGSGMNSAVPAALVPVPVPPPITITESTEDMIRRMVTAGIAKVLAANAPPPETTEEMIARLIEEGVAEATGKPAMRTAYMQNEAAHGDDSLTDPDERFPQGYHDVTVQKSNPNYSSPLARMLHKRSFCDPTKKLYVLVLDGESDEGMARLDHEELVLIRCSLADYRHLLATNDADAHGRQGALASDDSETLKKVPLVL